jgi:tetratricopeptide (TPR) repeat protein
MKRLAARYFVLLFPSLIASAAWAQAPATHLAEAADRSASSTAKVAPLTQHLFGSIPLSTQSEETRKFIELAWDKYENAMYDDAVVSARHATEKDPQSALGYGLLSFAARRGMPDPAALAKAKSLLQRSPADEQLLVKWMTSVQDGDLLPAISSMNDLLKRYPKDKHVLYVTAEWLFLQQDSDRAKTMLETALQIDPNFPAALNRLGYVYIESGDTAKAVASLKRYAQVEPASPNPEDSLAEILRISGDDNGSLEHYRHALQIDPKYFASQTGLGDTLTLMGDFASARHEYDRASQIADNTLDALYIKYQKALVYFWEGNPAEGRKELASLAQQAAEKKEPNAQFTVGYGRAVLAPDAKDELAQLAALATFLGQPLEGMSESDRDINLATVLRERVRIDSQNGLVDDADTSISRLEKLATSSRDLIVENAYESARGFAFFQQHDYAAAADGLAADFHSPLVLQQLAIAQDKQGNTQAAGNARNLLKYRRAPDVEWFLATHPANGASAASH